MASLSEKLQYLISVDAAGAIKGFQSVGNAAEKELGKAQSRMDRVGAGMVKFGAGALAAAGVVGAGLLKAANSFEDLALEASKFSDTTGTGVEAASRLIEVASDLGIETATVESSLNKMNKTLGASPDLFKQYGVEVAKAADGTTDVNQTFLNVVARLNAIKDPAERAAVATALLGKGWTGMSELIAQGSDQLAASLAAVSDAKVISPEEAQRAKDYRAAMDQLSDAVDDLTINIGQGAAPVLSSLASIIATGVEAFGKLNAVTGGAAGQFATFGAAGLAVVGTASMVIGKVIQMRNSFNDMGRAGKLASVSMGALAVVGALYSYKAQLAADKTDQVAKAIQNLSKVADGQVLQEFAWAVETGISNGQSFQEVLKQMAQDNLPGFRRALEMGTEAGAFTAETIALMNEVMAETVAENEQAERSTIDNALALDQLNLAGKAVIKMMEEKTKAALADIATMYDLEEATMATDESYQDYLVALTEADEAGKDANLTDAERAAILTGLREKQIDIAKGALNIAEAFADEQGATDGSIASYMLQIRKLEELKSKYPEIAAELQRYIDKLYSIPGVRTTNVQINYGSNAGVGGIARRAGGGPVSAGRPYIVGEEGPELVVPSASGVVIPAGQTERMMSGATGGGVAAGAPVVNVNQTISIAGDGRGLIDAITKATKEGVSAAWMANR